MALSLDDLNLLPSTGAGESGTPMRIALDAIDEDTAQPRQEFDDQSLAELAETIKDRGVRQPVSVRPHPMQPGRWILNFGARRLRASRLAEMDDIPAFVDHTANSVDQFIENEQRKGLTPLEIALFVQRSLNRGQSQADIARAIGKSRQYVTMATALIDAPDWLLSAYREGRCRGLNELHELRKLANEHPQYVEAWTSDRSPITRDRVLALRADLAEASGSVRRGTSALLQSVADGMNQDEKSRDAAPAPPVQDMPKTSEHCERTTARRLWLMARLDGNEVIVNTRLAPPQAGHLCVTPISGGRAEAVDAARLTLTGLVSVTGCQSD